MIHQSMKLNMKLFLRMRIKFSKINGESFLMIIYDDKN